MKIRNAQDAVQGRGALFLRLMGVLILNLQPEAVSEEFVAGDVAPGQLPRRVSYEWVWTSVLQWAIVSGLFLESRKRQEFSRLSRKTSIPAIKMRHQYNRVDHTVKVVVWVASSCALLAQESAVNRPVPCRGRRVTVLKLRPPQTPGLDRTAALSSDHSPLFVL
jgi:hypothetical protein